MKQNQSFHNSNVPSSLSQRSTECICREIAFLQLANFKYTCQRLFPINVCDRFTYTGDEEKFYQSCMTRMNKTHKHINDTIR